MAIVFIVMFGSKKLPDTARALGRSMRILKSETQALKADAQAGEGAEKVTAESVGDLRESVAER